MPDPNAVAVAEQPGAGSAVKVGAAAGAVAYFYDPATRQFVTAAGTVIRRSLVRTSFVKVIAAAKADMASLSQQLRDGVITLAEWQRAMAQKIKVVHVTCAVARGGWLQMSPSDWGYVGNRVKTQYAFLQNFANQIADGTQALNGVVSIRSQMYASAARSTQEALRRKMMGETGYVDERRILSPVENCPDCIEYAGRGWQPIGSLPEISDSICKVNCQCFFQYRLPDGQEGE